MSNELTQTEARRLKAMEHDIASGTSMVYAAMKAIHDDKLYRQDYPSWETYCRKRWGMSRLHAERLIRHGDILRIVDGSDLTECQDRQETVPIGSVLKESHTREVADLPTERAAEVVAETAKRTNGKVTAKSVREVRTEVVEQAESVVFDKLNREVPAGLREKHGAAIAIETAARQLDGIKRQVKELADAAGGHFLPLSEIEDLFRDLKGKVSHSRYWTACPRCDGKGCKRCEKTGYLPWSMRGMLSDEDKQVLGVK